MKKKVLAVLLAVTMVVSPATTFLTTPVMASEETPSLVQASDTKTMYRLYNKNNGEHFYTANQGEKDNLVRRGWTYEGIAWIAPASSDAPVYRLYNPNAGEHHYTTSAGERDSLVKIGWKYEGIGWYSGGSVPVYREYNPNAHTGTHNYTTSKGENDDLIRKGWRGEGIGWYASGQAVPQSTQNSTATSKTLYPTLREVGITGSRYTDTLNAKVDKALDNMKSILRSNHIDPDKLTDYEKAYVVLNYVANYNYGNEGTTAEDMLDTGSGTCTAYSDLIYCMARKMGLKNTWKCVMGRPVNHQGSDGMYQINGSQHQLCVTIINGKYYALDGNRAWLVWTSLQMEIPPEEITESYARYLLGQTNSYTKINP